VNVAVVMPGATDVPLSFRTCHVGVPSGRFATNVTVIWPATTAGEVAGTLAFLPR
jgi:hypothetical protein